MSAEFLPALQRALASLRYGSIQLIIHDGQIVRIERVERIRLTETLGSPHHPVNHSTAGTEDGSCERTRSCGERSGE